MQISLQEALSYPFKKKNAINIVLFIAGITFVYFAISGVSQMLISGLVSAEKLNHSVAYMPFWLTSNIFQQIFAIVMGIIETGLLVEMIRRIVKNTDIPSLQDWKDIFTVGIYQYIISLLLGFVASIPGFVIVMLIFFTIFVGMKLEQTSSSTGIMIIILAFVLIFVAITALIILVAMLQNITTYRMAKTNSLGDTLKISIIIDLFKRFLKETFILTLYQFLAAIIVLPTMIFIITIPFIPGYMLLVRAHLLAQYSRFLESQLSTDETTSQAVIS